MQGGGGRRARGGIDILIHEKLRQSGWGSVIYALRCLPTCRLLSVDMPLGQSGGGWVGWGEETTL